MDNKDVKEEMKKMKHNPEEIIRTLEELNPGAALADGFDEALIGICWRFGEEALPAYKDGKWAKKRQKNTFISTCLAPG